MFGFCLHCVLYQILVGTYWVVAEASLCYSHSQAHYWEGAIHYCTMCAVTPAFLILSVSISLEIIYFKPKELNVHIMNPPRMCFGLLSVFLNSIVFRLRVYSYFWLIPPSSSGLWVTDADTSVLNGWRTVWIPRDIDPSSVYWITQGTMELVLMGVCGCLCLSLNVQSFLLSQ